MRVRVLYFGWREGISDVGIWYLVSGIWYLVSGIWYLTKA